MHVQERHASERGGASRALQDEFAIHVRGRDSDLYEPVASGTERRGAELATLDVSEGRELHHSSSAVRPTACNYSRRRHGWLASPSSSPTVRGPTLCTSLFRPPCPSEDSVVRFLSFRESPLLFLHRCRMHVRGSTSPSPWTPPAPSDAVHQLVSRPFHRVHFLFDPRIFGFRPDPLKGILGQETRRVGIESTPHERGGAWRDDEEALAMAMRLRGWRSQECLICYASVYLCASNSLSLTLEEAC